MLLHSVNTCFLYNTTPHLDVLCQVPTKTLHVHVLGQVVIKLQCFILLGCSEQKKLKVHPHDKIIIIYRSYLLIPHHGLITIQGGNERTARPEAHPPIDYEI